MGIGGRQPRLGEELAGTALQALRRYAEDHRPWRRRSRRSARSPARPPSSSRGVRARTRAVRCKRFINGLSELSEQRVSPSRTVRQGLGMTRRCSGCPKRWTIRFQRLASIEGRTAWAKAPPHRGSRQAVRHIRVPVQAPEQRDQPRGGDHRHRVAAVLTTWPKKAWRGSTSRPRRRPSRRSRVELGKGMRGWPASSRRSTGERSARPRYRGRLRGPARRLVQQDARLGAGAARRRRSWRPSCPWSADIFSEARQGAHQGRARHQCWSRQRQSGPVICGGVHLALRAVRGLVARGIKLYECRAYRRPRCRDHRGVRPSRCSPRHSWTSPEEGVAESQRNWLDQEVNEGQHQDFKETIVNLSDEQGHREDEPAGRTLLAGPLLWDRLSRTSRWRPAGSTETQEGPTSSGPRGSRRSTRRGDCETTPSPTVQHR